jgi:GNAT superfamily N-acetyltransferase
VRADATIRPVEPADFDAVTELLELLGRAEVTDDTRDTARAIWDRQLDDPSAEHLVAEEDGRVVGFCSLQFRERLNYATPQAWVPDLIVAERARQRGIGRALLEEALRLAAERECWNLTLESGYKRAEAHHLYRSLGMTDAGKYFGKTPEVPEASSGE